MFDFSFQQERRMKNSSAVRENSRANDDDDVNEDIAAFYKAKDALLKRREETK
jgi:hypothetical protein